MLYLGYRISIDGERDGIPTFKVTFALADAADDKMVLARTDTVSVGIDQISWWRGRYLCPGELPPAGIETYDVRGRARKVKKIQERKHVLLSRMSHKLDIM